MAALKSICMMSLLLTQQRFCSVWDTGKSASHVSRPFREVNCLVGSTLLHSLNCLRQTDTRQSDIFNSTGVMEIDRYWQQRTKIYRSELGWHWTITGEQGHYPDEEDARTSLIACNFQTVWLWKQAPYTACVEPLHTLCVCVFTVLTKSESCTPQFSSENN